jgi:hypothetical protein
MYQNYGDSRCNRYHEYWIGGEIKPLNSISLSFEAQYGIQNNKLQYVSNSTYNNTSRYLFGELDQKTLGLTFRINYTINPELSIEYYGQPFVSAGKYINFNRITVTDADKFADRYHIFADGEISFDSSDGIYNVDENIDGIDDYSFSNPDFNFQQFRSNLVVRWEYLPGSTLYLVWSQGRTNSTSEGLFSYGSNMKDLFNVVPHNVFLVKLSYWFAL